MFCSQRLDSLLIIYFTLLWSGVLTLTWATGTKPQHSVQYREFGFQIHRAISHTFFSQKAERVFNLPLKTSNNQSNSSHAGRTLGRLYMTLTMHLFFVKAREDNSAYGTVTPSWRMICAGELKAIQMHWSKPVYIPQNNIVSQSLQHFSTACLATTQSAALSWDFSWEYIEHTHLSVVLLSCCSVLPELDFGKLSGDHF